MNEQDLSHQRAADTGRVRGATCMAGSVTSNAAVAFDLPDRIRKPLGD